LFDNLQDEDIQRLVAKHCPMDRAASTAVLNEAATALVNTAIARAQPNTSRDPAGQPADQSPGNPDDTTALVAAIVEVPDIEEYERWFWRSRGIQQPYKELANLSIEPSSVRVPPAPQASPPARNMPQAQAGTRARSVEPPPLQDCTNTPVNAAAPNTCRGPQEGNNSLRPNPVQGNGQQQIPHNPSWKGKGNGAKGGGKGSAAGPGPGAPDWWTKMAIPGKQAQNLPPQTVNKQQAQLAPQALHDPNDPNGPRLTSTILRAHEVKMATAESIARYSNAARPTTFNRGGQPPPGMRPPPMPQQQPMQQGKDENCVIS